MTRRADAAGHAIADVRRVVAAELVNTSGEEIIFDVRGSYAINTRVSVTDIHTESVLACWNVGVSLGNYRYGEFGRTIDCSYPLQQSYLCPNFYDSNDDSFGGTQISLDPGESITGRMTTIVRYEATAVPEPTTLALFGAACLGFVALRRRSRRNHHGSGASA